MSLEYDFQFASVDVNVCITQLHYQSNQSQQRDQLRASSTCENLERETSHLVQSSARLSAFSSAVQCRSRVPRCPLCCASLERQEEGNTHSLVFSAPKQHRFYRVQHFKGKRRGTCQKLQCNIHTNVSGGKPHVRAAVP